MFKEIERKWLLKPDINYKDIIVGKPHKIQDYYFNEYTRLRHEDNCWYITIKGSGTLIRDEFEFRLAKSEIYFTPKPVLKKLRYLIPYENHIFELNKFENLLKPLIIVECEFNTNSDIITLPNWLGQEITNDIEFYGYKLFQTVQ